MVNRPKGTGDWLIMMFHDSAKLQIKGRLRGFMNNGLVIWQPGDEHYYGNPSAQWTHSWLHVKGSFISHEIRRSGFLKGRLYELGDSSVMERGLLGIHEELASHAEPDPVIVKNLFVNMLRGLRRSLKKNNAPPLIPDRFLKIKAHIESSYSERIALDELARMAHLSTPYFVTQFKRYFAISPMEFVIRLRIQAASHHLRNANHSISEVAAMVGYDDLFYFSKLFKARLGLSPRSMRKRLFNPHFTFKKRPH